MVKRKVQTDKQRSTKHTHKTKDRVTRTPLKTEGELRCSVTVNSSCFTIGTRRVKLVTNPMISPEWGKDRKIFTTSGTYQWSFVTQVFHIGQPSHDNIFEVITSTYPRGTIGSVASLLAATHYQGHPDRNHKLWNILSTERYMCIYSICRCCWNVATYEWKVHSRKIEILSFVAKFRS